MKRFLPAALVLMVAMAAAAQGRTERPVAAVIPFGVRGLSGTDADALTDLFAYDLTRLGRFIVVGRKESERIIGSLDMPPMDKEADSYFYYVGDFLYADVLFSGAFERRDKALCWRVAAWSPETRAKLAEAEVSAADAAGLAALCPELLEKLLPAIPARFGGSLYGKYESALAPFTVRQRILFVFPEGALDAETAVAAEKMASLFSGALKSDQMLPLFLEYPYTVDDEASLPIASLAERFDAHRLVYLSAEKGERLIKVADSQGGVLAGFQPDRIKLGDADAALRSLEEGLPPLPQVLVARELADINDINRKLGALLGERRIMARPFALAVGQKLVKTVGHPAFQPTFNFFDLEANLFWYYSRLLGLGGGYGFSIGYPGTLDSSISGHPLFIQHELRLYPLAFRMPGDSGFMVNCFVSLNEHNASQVYFHPAEETTYGESVPVLYSRVGAEVGYFLNLGEGYALSFNILNLAWCIPLIEGPNFQDDRAFCGDIGGIGLLMRF